MIHLIVLDFQSANRSYGILCYKPRVFVFFIIGLKIRPLSFFSFSLWLRGIKRTRNEKKKRFLSF